MRATAFARLAPLALLLALTPSGHAGSVSYTYTVIADSTGPFRDFGATSPSINDRGTVAFFGSLRTGNNGIFTSAGGGQVRTIALGSAVGATSGDTSINNAGTVAFATVAGGGGNVIYTGDGGPLTQVATTAGAPFSSLGLRPVINDRGTVVFQANLDAGGGGVFLGGAGPVAALFTSDGSVFSSFGGVAVNGADVVAFRAFLDAGGLGVFAASPGGDPVTVAVANAGTTLDINDGGVVAFAGFAAGRVGVFTGSGGPLTPVADASGPYGGTGLGAGLAINNAGTVAFSAALAAGGAGIFTGPDPVADRVIAVGDPLLGSTVTNFGFAQGLNDAGQVAFRVTLADGRSAIVRADPVAVPEPSALAPLGAGALGLAGCRWKRRRADPTR